MNAFYKIKKTSKDTRNILVQTLHNNLPEEKKKLKEKNFQLKEKKRKINLSQSHYCAKQNIRRFTYFTQNKSQYSFNLVSDNYNILHEYKGDN